MSIQILGLTAGPNTSSSGGITADDPVILVVGLRNDGNEAASVTAWYSLSDGSSQDQTIQLQPGDQWLHCDFGSRNAGSYQGTVEVSAEIDFSSQAVGSDQVDFTVTASSSSSGDGSGGGSSVDDHNPNNYRLEVGPVSMYTEGGEIVHAEDEAFATEKVNYWAEVVNSSEQYLGPFEVQFLIDGNDIGWGGSSQIGLQAGESFWAQGSTDTLEVGNHRLSVKIESGEPGLFVGSEQAIDLRVLPPRSRRSMEEGDEAGREGWSQRMVYITLRDFAGQGINGEAYLEFSGPGGRSAERGQVEQGDLTLDNPWVPTVDGNMNITVRTDIAGGMTITGNGSIDDNEGGIVKSFTQGKRVMPVTITDQEDFRFMLSERGQIGVDFKLFGLGASGEFEIASEQEWTESHSEATTYEVWIPETYFDDQAHDTTRSR